MKAALKAKWVAALRSGKYRQCRGQLQLTGPDGGESFCCLGVLREISPAVRRRVDNHQTLGIAAFTYAGFSSDQENYLIYRNDGVGGYKPFSFRRIATWVEKNL